MARFDPSPGDKIAWNSTSYEVTAHPAVPMFPFSQEGRKAIVYQLNSGGDLFAFKVFKPAYRQASLVDTCDKLSQLTLSGLDVCQRTCLTSGLADDLLKRYREMEYAILMPWIQGSTWFDVLFAKTEIGLDAAKELAKNTAQVLAELEKRAFAHCDIAGGNVIVNMSNGVVQFIDVEDMFGPNLPPPSAFPKGTDGYQHATSRTGSQGQWCAQGDRFSAAVLLAEMLAWHEPQIRQASDDEHYFAADELQDEGSARYKLMLDILRGVSPEIADCFGRAWTAPTLADCPPLSEWEKLLLFSKRSNWLPIPPPPRPKPYKPEFSDPIKATPVSKVKFVDIYTPLPPRGGLQSKPPTADRTSPNTPHAGGRKGGGLPSPSVGGGAGGGGSPLPEIKIVPTPLLSKPKTDLTAPLLSQTVSPTISSPLERPTLQKMASVALNQPYTIAWSAVPDAQEYELQMTANELLSLSGLFEGVYRGPNLSLQSSQKAPGTYYYRVKAIGKGRESDWSEIETITVSAPVASQNTDKNVEDLINIVSITPSSALERAKKESVPKIMVATSPVDAFKSLLAAPTLQEMDPVKINQPYKVTWSEVAKATTYELQEAQNEILSASGAFKTIYSGPQHVYATSRDALGERYYRVKAVNNQQQSAWSHAKAIIIEPRETPNTPTLDVAQPPGETSILVTWSEDPNAEWYELQEAEEKWYSFMIKKEYKNIIVAGDSNNNHRIKGTRIAIRSHTSGKYSYQVRACNADSCSQYSEPKTIELKTPQEE